MLARDHIDPLARLRYAAMRVCIQCLDKNQPGLFHEPLHRFQRIAALQMGLRKFAEQVFLLFHKNRQIIFVDLILRRIIIFPDKAAVLPVFRNRAVTDDCFVFIDRIKIEDKKPIRVKIVVYQFKSCQ